MRTHGVDNVNAGTPFLTMGFNFRYTDIQASIGLVQLSKVKERIEKLKLVYEKYKDGLSEIDYIKLVPVDISKGEIPLYIEVLIEDREKLVKYLTSHNIETRPFYPDLDSAVHLKCHGDFPNAHLFGKQGLVLPCGPDQPQENIDYVLDKLKFYGQ